LFELASFKKRETPMTYSQKMIYDVWNRGRVIAEQDPAVWRKDECGAWIRREHYGQEASEYGWKIENVTAGGAGNLDDLRPLHCGNSFDPGVSHAKCHMTGDQKGVDPHEHIVSTPRNRRIGHQA
jgi:hypothetical protein